MLTPKITDYQILKYSQSGYLERAVAEYIIRGWQPLGGVSVCLYTTSGNYNVVSSEYTREICEQFAHSQNIDILISI